MNNLYVCICCSMCGGISETTVVVGVLAVALNWRIIDVRQNNRCLIHIQLVICTRTCESFTKRSRRLCVCGCVYNSICFVLFCLPEDKYTYTTNLDFGVTYVTHTRVMRYGPQTYHHHAWCTVQTTAETPQPQAHTHMYYHML